MFTALYNYFVTSCKYYITKYNSINISYNDIPEIILYLYIYYILVFYEVLMNNITVLKSSKTLLITGYAAILGVIDSHKDLLIPQIQCKVSNLYQEFKDECSLYDKIHLDTIYHCNIPILWNHQNHLIGICYRLIVNKKGIKIKAALNLPDWQKNLLLSGKVKGLSIGYIALKYIYDKVHKIRFLQEIDLKEISIVSSPSNKLAVIRSLSNIF